MKNILISGYTEKENDTDEMAQIQQKERKILININSHQTNYYMHLPPLPNTHITSATMPVIKTMTHYDKNHTTNHLL